MAEIISRIVSLRVPPSPPDKGGKFIYLLLGFLNCMLWGVGMVIIGLADTDMTDVLIGILQLIFPFIGWIWAIVWGLLIIFKNLASL